MEAFNVALTYKENIKTFDDILRQVELEAEHRGTNRNATFVTHSEQRKPTGRKRQRHGKSIGQQNEEQLL